MEKVQENELPTADVYQCSYVRTTNQIIEALAKKHLGLTLARPITKEKSKVTLSDEKVSGIKILAVTSPPIIEYCFIKTNLRINSILATIIGSR